MTKSALLNLMFCSNPSAAWARMRRGRGTCSDRPGSCDHAQSLTEMHDMGRCGADARAEDCTDQLRPTRGLCVKPRGAPRPRRQDICLEALGKDPSATQHRVAVKPACGNNQSHRLSRDGKIRQASMITTVYTLRSCSAAWTTARHIRRADSEYYRVASRSCLIDDKATRHECGGRSE